MTLKSLLSSTVCYVLIGIVLAVALYGIRFDDPYITYRYAENMAAGNGFVFNIGEPALITTTPLYALLLGALRGLGLDVYTASYAIGACSIVAGAILLRYLSKTIHPNSNASFFVGLCYVCFPLIWLTVNFETPLFIVVALAAFVGVAKQRWVLAGVLCGVAMGLRGDGAIVLALCAFSILGANKTKARNLFWLLAFALLVYAPLVAWLTAQFGSPIPSTLQTKSAQAVSGLTGFYTGTNFIEGAGLLIWAYTQQGGMFIVALYILLIGITAHIRRAVLPLPVLWLFLHTAGYTALGVAPYVWYYAPLLPGVCLLMGDGLAFIFAQPSAQFPSPKQRAAAAATKWVVPVATLLAFAVGNWLMMRVVHGATPPAPSTVASKVLPEAKVEIYERVGRWLHANTPQTATLGVTELGVISYFAQRHTIDFLGLTQPKHLADIRHGDFLAGVLREQPDYVALTNVNAVYDVNPQQAEWFTKMYSPVMRFDDATFWGSPMTVWQRQQSKLAAPENLDTQPHDLGEGWQVTGIASSARVAKAGVPFLVRVQLQAGAPSLNKTLRVQAEWLQGGDGLPVVSRVVFTPRWRTGERGWVDFPFVPQANLKEGAYQITVQWLEGGTVVSAGLIKVQPTAQVIVPRNPTWVEFENDMAVSAFGSFGAAVCANASLDIPTLWRVGAPSSQNLTVFVHVRDTRGNTVLQADAPPRHFQLPYPTSVWSVGEVVPDAHRLELANKLPAGNYALVVGLYDPTSNVRIRVKPALLATPDGGATLGELEVKVCD